MHIMVIAGKARWDGMGWNGGEGNSYLKATNTYKHALLYKEMLQLHFVGESTISKLNEMCRAFLVENAKLAAK